MLFLIFVRSLSLWLYVGIATKSRELSGPISRDALAAIPHISRYPISRDTFSVGLALPQTGAISPLGAIVGSLARVIAAIPDEALGFVGGHIFPPPQNTEIGPQSPCVLCAVIGIVRLAFICASFIPRRIAEWLMRDDCVR